MTALPKSTECRTNNHAPLIHIELPRYSTTLAAESSKAFQKFIVHGLRLMVSHMVIGVSGPAPEAVSRHNTAAAPSTIRPPSGL